MSYPADSAHPQSTKHHGGPTHPLEEDVAAVIRQYDSHTAAKHAVRLVEASVESRLRLDYDCLRTALERLVRSFSADPAVGQEQALTEAVELLEEVA